MLSGSLSRRCLEETVSVGGRRVAEFTRDGPDLSGCLRSESPKACLPPGACGAGSGRSLVLAGLRHSEVIGLVVVSGVQTLFVLTWSDERGQGDRGSHSVLPPVAPTPSPRLAAGLRVTQTPCRQPLFIAFECSLPCWQTATACVPLPAAQAPLPGLAHRPGTRKGGSCSHARDPVPSPRLASPLTAL